MHCQLTNTSKLTLSASEYKASLNEVSEQQRGFCKRTTLQICCTRLSSDPSLKRAWTGANAQDRPGPGDPCLTPGSWEVVATGQNSEVWTARPPVAVYTFSTKHQLLRKAKQRLKDDVATRTIRAMSKKFSAASRVTYQWLPRCGVLSRRAGASLWSRKRVRWDCHPMDTVRNTHLEGSCEQHLGRHICLCFRQQFCRGLKTKRSEPQKKILFPHLKQGN